MSFDRFHVVALANTALDQVRRAEVKTEPDLHGIRWGTLKDAGKWMPKQIEQMHWLQRTNLKTARGFRLKQALRKVFSSGSNITPAGALLGAWVSWATRCRLVSFKRLAATIKKHRDGIFEHFRPASPTASPKDSTVASKPPGRVPVATPPTTI